MSHTRIRLGDPGHSNKAVPTGGRPKDAVCFLIGGLTMFVPRRVFKDASELAAFVQFALDALPAQARATSEMDASVKAARGA